MPVESDGERSPRAGTFVGDNGPRRFSRRALLKSSIGAAVVIAVPDFLSSRGALASSFGADEARAGQGFFFLYGIPDPTTPPSLQAGQTPPAGAVNAVASQLAALPVSSPDHSKLGLVAMEGQDTTPIVRVTIVDKETGQIAATGTLALTGLPGAMILVTPTFSADSATLCLVLSITVPTNPGSGSKFDPATGKTLTVPTATWVSHHAIAYFDTTSRRFTGPFDLADAPSLARVNVAATADDLFLWTLAEPAALLAAGKAVEQPQLAVFPLGSGKPRFVGPASGAWPVNDEPIVALSNGKLARLVYGERIELYSSQDGSRTDLAVAPLAGGSAKPAPATMQLRPDGLLFISKPVVGRAAIVDPNKSFGVVSEISFPPPATAGGGPSGKTALSADGKTLYALGSAQAGGISAYDTSTGSLAGSHADGIQYSGLYALPSNVLLAVKDTSPRLSFFDVSLNSIGVADADLHVVEVF